MSMHNNLESRLEKPPVHPAETVPERQRPLTIEELRAQTAKAVEAHLEQTQQPS